MQRLIPASIVFLSALVQLPLALGQSGMSPLDQETKPTMSDSKRRLVEEFTADTLDQGEVKIGTDVEFGLTRHFMLGTDVATTILGAPTFQAKWEVWEKGSHLVALGMRAAYLTKETLLFGTVNDYYDDLEARMVRPQVSWSHRLSPRLTLHTFWSKGLGTIRAKLSSKGRRHLWEAKHPGATYDERNQLTQEPGETTSGGTEDPARERATSSVNQEKKASDRAAITTRTTQVQSIAGLAQERFQITGEFVREDGNKVLITSRIDQTLLEQLHSRAFRLTIAHHWIWNFFQMRLGVGAQYYSLSGRDLDGEIVSDAGVAPASDLSFYLRF
jgi:hypothetical protein